MENLEIVRDPQRGKFIDLRSLGKNFRFDIRYARADNFFGRAVYPSAGAYLQKEVAEDLSRAADHLALSGKGILVFDGYRPWEVTRLFWEGSSESARNFLANPARGSVHNRGCAIDCGLFDLDSGTPVEMPSDFDEFSERAYRNYAGGEEVARMNRDALIAAMEQAGFRGIQHEWWHFNHPAAANFPVFDVSFASLGEGASKAK